MSSFRLEDDGEFNGPQYDEGASRYVAGFAGGLLQAAWILRNAANNHEADALLSKSVTVSGGHLFAARVLRSYANGLDIEAGKPVQMLSTEKAS